MTFEDILKDLKKYLKEVTNRDRRLRVDKSSGGTLEQAKEKVDDVNNFIAFLEAGYPRKNANKNISTEQWKKFWYDVKLVDGWNSSYLDTFAGDYTGADNTWPNSPKYLKPGNKKRQLTIQLMNTEINKLKKGVEADRENLEKTVAIAEIANELDVDLFGQDAQSYGESLEFIPTDPKKQIDAILKLAPLIGDKGIEVLRNLEGMDTDFDFNFELTEADEAQLEAANYLAQVNNTQIDNGGESSTLNPAAAAAVGSGAAPDSDLVEERLTNLENYSSGNDSAGEQDRFARENAETYVPEATTPSSSTEIDPMETDPMGTDPIKTDPAEEETLGSNKPALDPVINTQVIADLVAEFGSYAYFQDPDKPEFMITENERGEAIEPINIIDYIESRNITSTVIMRQLFKKTSWSLNGGEINTLKWDANWSSLNEAQRDTYLQPTVEKITKLARTWGLQLTQQEDIAAIRQIAVKAGRLGLTNLEIQNEFYTNATFLWDPTNTETGVHARQRDLLRTEAKTYMLNISDTNLDLFSKQILTGEMTLEGIKAGFRSQAYNANPAIADLMDKGFTPQGYFSSYENNAELLLERPINFMGDDRSMYEEIAYGVTDANGISRPMTHPEADRYTRGLNEWQYTNNAKNKGSSLIENISTRFGAVA